MEQHDRATPARDAPRDRADGAIRTRRGRIEVFDPDGLAARLARANGS